MFEVRPGQQIFSVYAKAVNAYESPGGNWVIEGPLSNPSKDLQGETMNMAGLWEGLETFKALEQPVDWDHLWERTRDPDYLIGKGIDLSQKAHPKTGIEVPWLKAELMQSKSFARKAKDHYDAGLPLGFSVAGVVETRDPLDRMHITKPMVTSVAVTPVAVVSENNGCIQFVKSWQALMDGAAPEDIHFPIVPATQHMVASLFVKSLDIQPGLPHVGAVGVGALAVEDLGDRKGRMASAEERRRRRRRRLTKSTDLAARARQILALVLLERLTDVSGRRQP